MNKKDDNFTPAEVDALKRKIAKLLSGQLYSQSEAEICEEIAKQYAPRFLATVRDRERQRDALQRIINDMPAISQGIQDALAGRVKHLSCVEGGCERNELQRQLAEWKALGAETPGALKTVLELALEAGKTRDRQLAEYKNGNAYSKLGGQLAEASQARNEAERQLAEAREDTVRLMDALVDLLELVESNAPDGYYTENRHITRARETVQQAIDAARERVTPSAASSPTLGPKGTT